MEKIKMTENEVREVKENEIKGETKMKKMTRLEVRENEINSIQDVRFYSLLRDIKEVLREDNIDNITELKEKIEKIVYSLEQLEKSEYITCTYTLDEEYGNLKIFTYPEAGKVSITVNSAFHSIFREEYGEIWEIVRPIGKVVNIKNYLNYVVKQLSSKIDYWMEEV